MADDHATDQQSPPPIAAAAPQRFISRFSLALLMVLVAGLGAATAYRAAKFEQETTELQRKLALGQMADLAARNKVIADQTALSHLDTINAKHRAQFEDLRAQAEQAVAAKSDATALDMRAELENAQSRLIGIFKRAYTGLGKDDLRTGLDRVAEEDMIALGFSREQPMIAAAQSHVPEDAHGTPKADADTQSYESIVSGRQLAVWKEMAHALEAVHQKIPKLALAVVGYILALMFFTIAELEHTVPVRSNRWLAGGATLAAAAIGWSIFVDHDSWRSIVFGAAIFAVAVAPLKLSGVLKKEAEGEVAHLPELEPMTFFGSHMLLRNSHGAREKVLILVIAVTVLLSTVVGYFLANAQVAATEATRRAFESEIAYNQLSAERNAIAAAVGGSTLNQLLNARLECALASQFVHLDISQATQGGAAEAVKWRDRKCKVLANPDLARTADRSDRDNMFDSVRFSITKAILEVYYDSLKSNPANPAQLLALADGHLNLASWWTQRVTQHLLALTFFAIALYLLGQSLGMEGGPPSFVLAGFGCFGALLAFVISLHQLQLTPAPPADIAAQCPLSPAERTLVRTSPDAAVELAARVYGTAKHDAAAGISDEDYEKASQLFDCVTAIRPDFSLAYMDSTSTLQRVRFDRDGNFFNFPNKAWLEKLTRAQERSLEALRLKGWWPSASRFNGLGFDLLLLGLSTGDLGKIHKARATLQQGIDSFHVELPDKTLDAAKLKSASRQQFEALNLLYLNLALTQVLEDDTESALRSVRIAMQDLKLTENRDLVASTLTDFNNVEANCARLFAGDARRCEHIKPTIDAVRLALRTGTFEPTRKSDARVANLSAWTEPSRLGWTAKLAGVDYDKDQLWAEWSVFVPDWNTWRVLPGASKIIPLVTHKAGEVIGDETIFDLTRTGCFGGGKYRMVLYVNGVAVKNAVVDQIEMPAYEPDSSLEMDMEFCRPKTWKYSALNRPEDGRYLIRAFANEDGQGAAYLLTFFAGREADQSAIKTKFLWQALKLVTTLSKEPPPVEKIKSAIDKFDGCKVPGQAPGGFPHKEWVMRDGMVHVALIAGKGLHTIEACHVLNSIGNYFDRGEAKELAR